MQGLYTHSPIKDFYDREFAPGIEQAKQYNSHCRQTSSSSEKVSGLARVTLHALPSIRNIMYLYIFDYFWGQCVFKNVIFVEF